MSPELWLRSHTFTQPCKVREGSERVRGMEEGGKEGGK